MNLVNPTTRSITLTKNLRKNKKASLRFQENFTHMIISSRINNNNLRLGLKKYRRIGTTRWNKFVRSMSIN